MRAVDADVRRSIENAAESFALVATTEDCQEGLNALVEKWTPDYRGALMAGLYFEEFDVGREFHHEFSRTVTEMDNTMFSLLTMNPQPLHIDAHFAEKTEFGQRLFNSLYTLGIMIGMSVYDTTLGTTIGNLGMTDVKFPKPVFHGDTLKAHTKIISKRASKSRPTQGIVEFEHTMTNQRDEVVASCRRTGLMHCKPKA